MVFIVLYMPIVHVCMNVFCLPVANKLHMTQRAPGLALMRDK